MEEWKDINGFEGLYQISSFGRVKSLARIIKRKRYHLIELTASILCINIPLMALIATTIIIIGETIPALTAASPKTSPPKIEMAVPIEEGIRISLSLKISNEIIIKIASIKAGKGTDTL